MTAITWHDSGSRIYEIGIDRGVLYPSTGEGVPWNGLISVKDSNQGGETSAFYFDGVKYLDWIANEDFSGTIEAYSAPLEFMPCDGAVQLALGLFATQQPRLTFGFSYRTLIGNELEGTDFGYKLHLVYNALAQPSSRSVKSIAEKNEPDSLEWDFDCVPPEGSTYRPTAHFIINSTLADPDKLQTLEDLLYGADDLPALPDQATVIATLT